MEHLDEDMLQAQITITVVEITRDKFSEWRNNNWVFYVDRLLKRFSIHFAKFFSIELIFLLNKNEFT